MPTPVLIAIGAGFASWLLAVGFASRGNSERERRQRLIARVRGDVEAATPSSRGQERRSPGRRKRPRLALRRPQRGLLARLQPKLTRAGLDMQPGEFFLFAVVFTAVGAVAGFAVLGAMGGGGGLLLGLALPFLWLRRRISARRGRINGQLNDLLQVVSGGLSAGQSFPQALAAATREVGDPLGSELRVMLSEVELGATIEASLGRLRDRVGDDDLDLVIDAVLIQRRVGGNLSEVLDNIAWTIRERIRIRGEVRALTGQARLSGMMLGGLPLFLAVGLYLLNPEYMQPLIQTDMGHMVIAAGLVGQGIGFVIMRKIANVEV